MQPNKTKIELAVFKSAKLFAARQVEEINRNDGKQLMKGSESLGQKIVK